MSFDVPNFLAAAEAGAAWVYHRALQVQPDVTKWDADHPALSRLLHEGLAVGTGYLSKAGAGGMIAADILTGLKILAIKDPSVPSTMIPAAAPAAPPQ